MRAEEDELAAKKKLEAERRCVQRLKEKVCLVAAEREKLDRKYRELVKMLVFQAGGKLLLPPSCLSTSGHGRRHEERLEKERTGHPRHADDKQLNFEEEGERFAKYFLSSLNGLCFRPLFFCRHLSDCSLVFALFPAWRMPKQDSRTKGKLAALNCSV